MVRVRSALLSAMRISYQGQARCSRPRNGSYRAARRKPSRETRLQGQSLGMHGLIFLVGPLEVRDLMIRLEMPDARGHLIDQIMIVRHQQ